MTPAEALLRFFRSENPDAAARQYDSGDQNTVWRVDNGAGFHTDAIGELLLRYGYRLQQETEIDGNQALTFHNDGQRLLHMYFCPAERCVRIVDDPVSQWGAAPESGGGNAVCPLRLWQFEIDHSLIDCGMCYIFQLRDGSYFLIDSGHHFSVRDDNRIADFLLSHSPDPKKAVVRGWFFSHCHSDHICKFLDILRFHPEIEIQALYYNFVRWDHPSAEDWDVSERQFQRQFYQTVGRYSIPSIKLHSFQRFSVGDVCFTVLCTHEDVFPQHMEDFNNSSTVLMAEAGADKICFPGDASGLESPILERRFPSFLRCDVLQQAHHAHFGLSEAFYRKANARVLLSPTTQIKYDEEFGRYPANAAAASLAKHVFVASNGTVELAFPLGEHPIRLYPDEIFEDFEGISRLWNYTYTDVYKNELLTRYRNRQRTEELPY